MELLWLAFFILGSLSALHFLIQLMTNSAKQPPGPWNLPVIGSLHRLAGSRTTQHRLRDLSSIHGPVMRIKLGEINTVVVSSAEAAKEVMRTRDTVFASRPVNHSMDILFYGGNDVAFGPYGRLWREMRRICTVELLSTKRVRSFCALREEETSRLIVRLTGLAGREVNLSGLLAENSNNVIFRAVIGDRSDDQRRILAALDDVVDFMTGLHVADLFPSIPFLGFITGFSKRLKKCHKILDQIAETIIQEHKNKRNKVLPKDDNHLNEEEDLVDALLRFQQEDNFEVSLSNDNIKAIITDMLIAGSETTSTTLEWAMSEIVRNPCIMNKAQKEIRESVGGGDHEGSFKLVDEEQLHTSRNKQTYLSAIIKETLRLHPPPLLLPRENQEDNEIMGYVIPAKTRVLVNAWAIARDKRYWNDPDIFCPERFEESSLDFNGLHFEYMPFGAGKRICPGIQFAQATLEIVLGNLLYYFDWEFVRKEGENDLDMSEDYGITARRKHPLILVPTLRTIPPSSI